MNLDKYFGSAVIRSLGALIVLFSTSQLIARDYTIRISVDHFPPFIIIKGNSISGIDVEITAALLEKMNLRPRFVVNPWKRALRSMKFGKLDIITGVYRRPDREKFLLFIKPYYVQDRLVFYSSRTSRFQIRRYQDLFNRTITIERGSKHFAPFDTDRRIKKYGLRSNRQALGMVLKGRADAALGNSIVFDYLIAQKGQRNRFWKSKFIYSGKKARSHLALSRKSKFASRINDFNREMKKLKARGVIRKIINKYSNNRKFRNYPLH